MKPWSPLIVPGVGPVTLSIESCGGCPYEGATELVGDDWLPTCRHDSAPADLVCVEDGYPPPACPLREDPRVALRTEQALLDGLDDLDAPEAMTLLAHAARLVADARVR